MIKPAIIAIFWIPLVAGAGDLWTEADLADMDAALAELRMSRHDFGFDKDVAEPEALFEWSREWLREPFRMTQAASDLLTDIQEQDAIPWPDLYRALEVSPSPSGAPTVDIRPGELPLDWFPLLNPLREDLARAQKEVADALTALSAEAQSQAALSFLSGVFFARHSEEAREALRAFGFNESDIAEEVREDWSLDPAPDARTHIQRAAAIQLDPLLSAARRLYEAAVTCKDKADVWKNWPSHPIEFETEQGVVRIGTMGADRHGRPAAILIDPGGDDVYLSPAGTANGLDGRPVSVILDLGGDDRYHGPGLLAPGAALFGVSILLDASGDDVYSGDWVGAAAGCFGVSLVEDAEGDDVYRSQAMAQGAGYVGAGVLHDRAGRDVYDVGFAGQGYAGPLGYGLLLDRTGHDLYRAGGVRPDYERHDDRFLSLAQGFSIGVRPWAGGGRGVLVDLAGDDRYIADVYGQGVGYWYAAGMLLDQGGNDQYQMFQYGQGAGIHLSLGLLSDAAGRDQYTGYVLTQGAAHDYGVGFLIEGGGDDTYTADHYSQGRGMNNSLGILLDRSGRDGYFSRQCDRSQGIGHFSDLREYGSIALLLDLAGEDQYSCGGENNQSVLRPSYGILYDREGDHE